MNDEPVIKTVVAGQALTDALARQQRFVDRLIGATPVVDDVDVSRAPRHLARRRDHADKLRMAKAAWTGRKR